MVEPSPGVIYQPTATKTPTPTNYISDSEYNLLTQYIPELEDQVVDRFGTQMITGLLAYQGKESAFQADLIKWNEEGRLTQLATGVTRSSNVFTSTAHTFRVGETIVVRTSDGSALTQGQITEVTTDTFTALNGNAGGWSGTTGLTVYADSNEFAKGSAGMTVGLNSQIDQFTNVPTTIKETLTETRTNLALRTWVKTDGGYLWYYKNLKDTKMRFNNALENKLILGNLWGGVLAASGVQGTQGLFSCAREGNIFTGQAVDLDDFDEIVDRMNAQGMISNNYMYNTSAQNGVIDRMLKAENVTSQGWGEFSNEAEALKLGFKSFNYRNYNFYKSNWRFLDNPTTEGSATGATKVHGFMFPMGGKNVYDVQTGTQAVQPFLNVKYRASQEVNRKYEMSIFDWAQGTNNEDKRRTEFQSERCLMVTGRNNLMLFQG